MRMRRARQRYHGESVLEGAQFRARLVWRPAGRNDVKVVEVKPPFGGARHSDVAGVNGIKGAAEKCDMPASRRFRAAGGGPLRFQMASGAFRIFLSLGLFAPARRPSVPVLRFPPAQSQLRFARRARELRAVPAHWPCLSPAPVSLRRWPRRWRRNRVCAPRNAPAAAPAANGPWWHRAWSPPRSSVSPPATR